MNDFLIVVVTYNPKMELLKANIIPRYYYLIIDNSEIPFNFGTLNSNKNIRIIFNNENLGMAKALNIGAEYALLNGYKWIITMDQDSCLTQNTINRMFDYITNSKEKDGIAVLSPRHILQNGLKIKLQDESKEYSESINTMTSGNFVNLEIWKKVKRFNEKLFIDMVDMDYYCKCIVNGYKVIILNNVYMQHKLGNLQRKKLLGKTFKVMNHDHIRKYYQFRNGFYVYFKYRKQVLEIKYVPKFLIGTLLTTILFEKQKTKKLWYIFKGVVDFFRKKFETI